MGYDPQYFRWEKAAAARFVACCGPKEQHRGELQKNSLTFQFLKYSLAWGGRTASPSPIFQIRDGVVLCRGKKGESPPME